MKKSTSKIQLLKKEIEVKNMVIGELLQAIAKNKIQLPSYVLKILEGLYPQKKQEHKPIDVVVQ